MYDKDGTPVILPELAALAPQATWAALWHVMKCHGLFFKETGSWNADCANQIIFQSVNAYNAFCQDDEVPAEIVKHSTSGFDCSNDPFGNFRSNGASGDIIQYVSYDTYASTF